MARGAARKAGSSTVRGGGRRAAPSPSTTAAKPSHRTALQASRQTRPRVELVDAARGLAVATMIAYHFCFDLTYYGWADWPMLADPRWIAWRSTIVASFVFVVGVALALRDPDAPWLERGFVRRWLQIAMAATLVTAGSSLLFPERFIYFGVLHFVAVALWLCRRAPGRPWLSLAFGVVALVAGFGIASTAFDPRWIDWIGFAATKPPTEDYVPLFPWLGVVLVGCAVGGWWATRGFRLSPAVAATWNHLPPPARGLLTGMGRWSLTIYLVHQPLLLAAMGVVKQLG